MATHHDDTDLFAKLSTVIAWLKGSGSTEDALCALACLVDAGIHWYFARPAAEREAGALAAPDMSNRAAVADYLEAHAAPFEAGVEAQAATAFPWQAVLQVVMDLLIQLWRERQ